MPAPGKGQESLGVRVDAALKRRLQRAAKADHRNFSDEVRYILEDHLEKREL